jgi:uncharacterized membrane protein YhaH (DUF805 family)
MFYLAGPINRARRARWPGRVNRACYWLGLAMTISTLVAINMLSSEPVRISEAILAIFCVPRLHDIGRSGWWLLAPLALEVGGGIASAVYLPPETMEAAPALVIVGFLIWLGAVPGEVKANRFGDPPPPGLQFRPSTPAG